MEKKQTTKKNKDLEVELMKLLSPVDTRYIVSVDKQRGLVYIGGEQIDQNLLNNLRAEAQFFKESHLWKLMYESPKELAQKTLFVDAESLVDLQKGKTMLYTLDVQKKILDIFLKK